MININELRLGNLIEAGRFGSRVIFGLSKDYVTISVDGNLRNINYSESISPISLTNRFLNNNFPCFYSDGLYNWKLSNVGQSLCVCKSESSNDYEFYIRFCDSSKFTLKYNLEYIHELQNLMIDFGLEHEANNIILL